MDCNCHYYAGRSLTYIANDAYAPLWNKMIAGFDDGSTNVHFSSAGDIAEVVFQAATDNKEQLRYVAGPDAQQLEKDRIELGLDNHFKKVSSLYKM